MSISKNTIRLVLLLAVVVIACVLLIKNGWPKAPNIPVIVPSTTMSTTELHASWRTSVQSALFQYDKDQDARVAEQTLLAMRVTEQDRDAHLALTLAFHTLAQSRAEGKAQLTQARAQFEGGK
jgi:hypothetical protein